MQDCLDQDTRLASRMPLQKIYCPNSTASRQTLRLVSILRKMNDTTHRTLCKLDQQHVGQLYASRADSSDCWRIQFTRSEEHTSELQSRFDLVCRLLLEKKNINFYII